MQTSKIHQSVNYGVLTLLGVVLVYFALVTVFARAQSEAGKAENRMVAREFPAPIVKPLPAELQAEFRAAQDEVATLQARLSAATLRGQNILYKAALELRMTADQAETCEVKQVVRDKAGPVWSFVCPPDPVQTPAPEPAAKKQ